MDGALKYVEEKHNFAFKPKQLEAIKSIVNGQDTFVVLPTGYGKTKIHAHLPEIFELCDHDVKATVLVISPLQALMLDQVNKLERLGIRATVLGEIQQDKSVADRVTNGQFSIVFCSPEAALTPGLWRRSITHGAFQDCLKAVIIDEAHCITQWGGEFRQDYGKLGELRSVVPNSAVFVSLTATATTSMMKDIMKTVHMDIETTNIVSVLPERPNIVYHVKKSNKNLKDLQWLVDDLLTFGKKTKKTIIYCRNIVTCANLYHFFKLSINELCESLDDRLIAMFHRSTADINKDHVLSQFPKSDSNLRVVFATIAFGMGVDIPDIERVIHWGGPRGLEQYSQESGRAGRDGRPAISIVYFSGYDLAKGNCSEEVRQFCKSDDCLRDILHKHFKLDKIQYDITKPDKMCTCCSICKLKCDCGSCTDDEFLTTNQTFLFDENLDSDIKRSLSSDQLSLLHENLMDYKECLLEEDNELFSELDDTCIDTIVMNSVYLLCEDDLISLGLVSHQLVADILSLINEI